MSNVIRLSSICHRFVLIFLLFIQCLSVCSSQAIAVFRTPPGASPAPVLNSFMLPDGTRRIFVAHQDCFLRNGRLSVYADQYPCVKTYATGIAKRQRYERCLPSVVLVDRSMLENSVRNEVYHNLLPGPAYPENMGNSFLPVQNTSQLEYLQRMLEIERRINQKLRSQLAQTVMRGGVRGLLPPNTTRGGTLG